jgi:FixJ family two-component response regulator
MNPNPEPQTILVVDDDRSIRTLVQAHLERAAYRVLTAADGEEGLHVFRQHQDRIMLMVTDVVMPKLDGLQLADAVLAMRPHLPVIFMSGNTPNVDRGWGCLAKPFASSELVSRVRQALASKELKRTILTGSDRMEQPANLLSRLTNRELQVLQLICAGCSSKAIAHKLGISFKTVVSHRSHILRKAGVHEVVTLVRFAMRAGYVEA